MTKREKLYEGKAKILWTTDSPEHMVQEFKDDATAFDGTKHAVVRGKGQFNNAISSRLFEMLRDAGVRTHFVRKLSEREMLVERLRMLPVEVVVRNSAAGSIVKRLGATPGARFDPPLVEFFLKNDALHDPLITEDHIRALGLAPAGAAALMRERALAVNDVLRGFLAGRGVDLVDFKLEFGMKGDEIVLGDEVSPDTCRLHDASTGRIMDKDRFRQDLGGFMEAYGEVLDRVTS
jgi:phosphoribosylaminoimidazole-succinocarboxamide synthase